MKDKSRKWTKYLPFLALPFVIAAAAVLLYAYGIDHKPFATWEDGEISRIAVVLGEREPYALAAQEKEEMVGLLQDIVLQRRDYKAKNLIGGQPLWLEVEMTDGTQWTIHPTGARLSINGAGYLGEPEACFAFGARLNDYGERIAALYRA